MPWGAAQPESVSQQIVRITCQNCEEFDETGPLKEVRELHEEHRLTEHGIEAHPSKLRRSRRSPWRSEKTLQENIVAARTQGAAKWFSEDEE